MEYQKTSKEKRLANVSKPIETSGQSILENHPFLANQKPLREGRMYVKLSKKDCHAARVMGIDTQSFCEMGNLTPRLENAKQSTEEACILGFKAEFAIARLFNSEPPAVNVVSDGGVDLWLDDCSVDVKITNRELGDLIIDNIKRFKADIAILVGKTNQEDVLRVNGWIGKKEFQEKAIEKDFGYGPRLYVPLAQ